LNSLPAKTNGSYRHLPENFSPENRQHIGSIIKSLRDNPPHDFESASEWFETFIELSDATNEIQTRLDLLFSMDTQSQETLSRLQNFESDVLSLLMESRAELMDIYLSSPWRGAMHADDGGKVKKEILARRRLTTSGLGALQIEENQLVREFKTFSSTTTCTYFGRPTPIGIVIGKLNDPRPEIRREAFMSHWRRIRESKEWLEDLFTRLLKNRLQQAKVAGASSYVELCFTELGRFDYTAEDCSVLRTSIQQAITPIVSNLQSRQLLSLGTPTLRPWDAAVWPKLTPAEFPGQGDITSIINAGGRIASRIHKGFGVFYQTLLQRGCIDVHPRNMKAPGAFCVALPETKTPFIFGNFAGHFRDAFTLLHEFGHALHGSASLQIRNTLVRHPGLEFCEVASMGLEFLAQPFLSEFWPRAGDANKAWALHCFNALQFWPFMAMLDEWQHVVYQQELVNPADRSELWRELSARYRPGLDWSGVEDFEELGWISRPHPITSPFYYIDYGIAQLGAVELWAESRRDYKQAVENYINGLSLGAQRSLPQLFQASGLHFNFSQAWVAQLGEILSNEIESLT
jgi:oligoendopeptidase F